MLKKSTLFMLIMAIFLFYGCGDGTSDTDDIKNTPDGSEANPVTTPADTPEPGNNGGDNGTEDGTIDNGIENGPGAKEEFFFVFNDVEIRLGDPALPIIDDLGPYQDYFEAPSCAFDGVDRSWFYSGFVVHAFPLDGDDFVLSVILTDDVYGTDKRIYIGMTYDDMVAAYGSDYEQNQDQFLYRLGSTSLAFIIPGDHIASITYRYEDAPEF